MKSTKEIIKALRATQSRSKRALLDAAADRLEDLQAENDSLISKMLKEGKIKSYEDKTNYMWEWEPLE